MIAALWWAWVAWAAPPTCAEGLDPVSETISVAWVSPLKAKVGRRGWMQVVPTAELAAQVRQGEPWARTLQRLGQRRRDAEPRRTYKVTIFDVRATDLCRPVAGMEGGAIAGVAACSERMSRARRAQDGCGSTRDRKTRGPGLTTFWIRWEDAARSGFCVLPAERFRSGD